MEQKLLVLDDEEEFLTDFRIGLRRAEWRTAFASTPGQARRLCEQESFDIVMYDPGVQGGADFVEFFHNAHPNSDVVLVSGRLHGMELAQAVKAAPIAAAFEKPVSMARLGAKLEQLFKARATEQRIEISLAAAQAALDHAADAIVIFRAKDQFVLYANPAAQANFTRRNGEIFLNANYLAAADKAVESALRSALKRYLAVGSPSVGDRECLQLTCPITFERQVAVLTPLTGRSDDLLIALTVGGKASCPAPPERAISCAFELTKAEAKLAASISEGLTLRAAALRQSITPETARTYLKRIFSKTGAHRQAEVALIVRSLSQTFST